MSGKYQDLFLIKFSLPLMLFWDSRHLIADVMFRRDHCFNIDGFSLEKLKVLMKVKVKFQTRGQCSISFSWMIGYVINVHDHLELKQTWNHILCFFLHGKVLQH